MGIFSSIAKRMTAELDPFLGPSLGSQFDETPLVLYDVGAAGGVYCPVPGGPGKRVRIYGFEPVKRSYDELEKMYAGNPHVECRQVALASRDGTVKFNQLEEGQETRSSLYSRDGLDLSSEWIEVESARLDSVPERYGFPAPDFIKLDTEGSEAEILQAGEKLLDQEVLGVLTEISFWRRDTGGAVFAEIDRMMTKAGFILFDLQVNRSHVSLMGGKKDKLRSGDALYLRDYTQLIDRLKGATTEHKRVKLLKLLSLCLSWRYLHYAIELIDYGRTHKLISPKEFSTLSKVFVSTADVAMVVPKFPGREPLARFFDLLSYVLHPQASKGLPTLINAIGNPPLVARKGVNPGSAKIFKPVICEGTSRHIKMISLEKDPA